MTAKVKAVEVNTGEELKPWGYHVSRDDLVAYAQASGDHNPIHQDENTAKMVGLPDVIAHGMHSMAKIGQYVTDWAGDPAAVLRIKSRFTKPVVVPKDAGNDVTISGVVERLQGTVATLRVSAVTSDGTNVAEAEAEVQLA